MNRYSSRHRGLLLLFLLLLALGISACQRNKSDAAPSAIPPNFLLTEEHLPRLTPHVTAIPTPTQAAPVALTPYAPEPTPTPTATPEPTPTPAPTSAPVAPLARGSGHYVVQPGDTLFDIAQRLNIDLRQLAEFNGITDPTTLEVGQTLYLP